MVWILLRGQREVPLMVLTLSANVINFFSHLFIFSYLEVVLP
jgi:hypothetical protein